MGYVPEAVQGAQRAGNYGDISLWGKKRIMKYIRPRALGDLDFTRILNIYSKLILYS